MADPVKVACICGSLRKKSFNAALVRQAQTLAPPGMSIAAAPPLNAIPLYNHDVQESDGFPAPVSELAAPIRSSDGVLICSPEYNWSIPGVLKNGGDTQRLRIGVNPGVYPRVQRPGVGRPAGDPALLARHLGGLCQGEAGEGRARLAVIGAVRAGVLPDDRLHLGGGPGLGHPPVGLRHIDDG